MKTALDYLICAVCITQNVPWCLGQRARCGASVQGEPGKMRPYSKAALVVHPKAKLATFCHLLSLLTLIPGISPRLIAAQHPLASDSWLPERRNVVSLGLPFWRGFTDKHSRCALREHFVEMAQWMKANVHSLLLHESQDPGSALQYSHCGQKDMS